jgi:hypothetical protein
MPLTQTPAPPRTFEIAPEDSRLLVPLLQQGVQVEIENGCALEDLLCRQWGLDREYVYGRISTLFLDGRPVDDIETARVRDGAVLALSCAMPGLIGATMRRGGVLASFRSSISHREEQQQADANARGTITVKLFNMLTRELAPPLLARGIIASRTALTALFDRYPEMAALPDDRLRLVARPGDTPPT